MQLFVFTSEHLQAIRWRSKYNGCPQRIWKQSWGFEPKVEGSNPSKTFFCFRKEAEIFSRFTCLQKKHVLMYYAHVKRLHSVKWRGLYGDTTTMQELSLKTCTSSAWRKRSQEWNCHWIVYRTGLQHSLALADLPLRKLWKRRRHRTSSNSQSYHRHLRRKCHWMTDQGVVRRTIASMYSLKKVLPSLDNIRTEIKQSIGYTGSKGRLRKDLLHMLGAQWLSGRVLDSRPKGRGFEPHRRHCVVVLEQDTFILA